MIKPLSLGRAAMRAKKNGICATDQDQEECRDLIEKAQSMEPVTPEDKYMSIEEAAFFMGVSAQTLRNWEQQGKLMPARTEGKHRRYTKNQLLDIKKQQMGDMEFLIPGVTPNDILDMVQKLLSTFDPIERVDLTIRNDSLMKKLRITIDSSDGLCTVTKSFDMKD